MPRAAKKNFLFTDEDVVPPEDALLEDILPTGETPDPTPYVPPGTNPPPGHPDYHPPKNPVPAPENPRPRPGEPSPYETPPSEGEPDESTGNEGDPIANPDVPGSSPDPNQNPTENPAASSASQARAGSAPMPLLDPVHYGEIMPPANRQYTSRITILDAFQYPGNVSQAPAWVDRSWIGYGDYDPVRGIEPGPCLRIPMPGGQVVLARVGDYVCQQAIKIAEGIPDEVRIEVWDKPQFERLFLPS